MQRMMRVAIMVIGGIFVCSAWVTDLHAADVSVPEVLTFDLFCQKVVAYYPKLKGQEASVEIAIARKFQAVAGALPHLTGLASMTTSNDQVYVFGTLLKQRAFTQSDFALSQLNNPAARTNYSIGLHGEIPIFDALQTAYKIKTAQYMVQSARYDELFSRMEAVLVATDAYLRTIEIEKLLAIVAEVRTSSEEDIAQAQDLKEKGMVLGADFYAAKVALGTVRSIQNELLAQRDRAYALLNILMGQDPLTPLHISAEVPHTPETSGALTEWLATAYHSRPDLKSMEEAVRAREAEYTRERLRALPTISAFGDLAENTQNFNTGGGSFAVGLKGSIDIFDPDYYARVRIAKETLRKIEHERDLLRDTVAREVTSEYAHFGALVADLPVITAMQADALEAVKLTAPLYREGRKSIADLLEMRLAYIETNRRYYGSIVGSQISRASMLFISGTLDEAAVARMITGGA